MLKLNVDKFGTVGRRSILDSTINPYDLVISPYEFVDPDEESYEEQVSSKWMLTDGKLKYGSTKSILKRSTHIDGLFYKDLFNNTSSSQSTAGTIKKRVQFVSDALPLERFFTLQSRSKDSRSSRTALVRKSKMEDFDGNAYETYNFNLKEIVKQEACARKGSNDIHQLFIKNLTPSKSIPNNEQNAKKVVVTLENEPIPEDTIPSTNTNKVTICNDNNESNKKEEIKEDVLTTEILIKEDVSTTEILIKDSKENNEETVVKCVTINNVEPLNQSRLTERLNTSSSTVVNSESMSRGVTSSEHLLSHEDATIYDDVNIYDNPSVPPRTKKSNRSKSSSNIHAIKIECPKYTSNTYIFSSDENYKVQIKNDSTVTTNNHTTTEKKTSILINGDDCYSTINVNNNVPLYYSSVELKYDDIDCTNPIQNGVIITTSDIGLSDNNNYESTNINVSVLCVSNNAENNKTNHSNHQHHEHHQDSLMNAIWNDPLEALRQNLIPHVCGKKTSHSHSHNHNQEIKNNPKIVEIIDETPSTSMKEAVKEKEAPVVESPNEEIYSDNSVSTRYESLDMNSDYYTDHSNRSSITEDDPLMRTKFYDLLADSATSESLESEDHHYESIKLNCDPIYEDIDVPPPLPQNPPPQMVIDDLQLDKEYTTRSIFEGASKYDILSYLVDAKERGLVIDDSSSYNSENSPLYQEYKDSMSIYSKLVELNNTNEGVNNGDESPQILPFSAEDRKAADVERKDSGVGSETSKSICDKYRKKVEPNITCEDCEADLEYGSDNDPLLCRKCKKKRCERKEIIAEIVDTEEKYCRDLQIILEEFYQPMLVAGLLTPDQLSAIFLNIEELMENSQALAERLRDAVEIAVEQGDEDLLTVNIGKLFLEASPMLHAFEKYCVRQGNASLLLAGLEKEKELLRIFLKVSQMENVILRRMNLNSFLMVPVQRVTKYPLLLARLYKVTPQNHETLEQLKEAQHNVELHLNHINSETKDVPSKLWRRINSSSNRKTSCEMDLVSIKLRKIAVDVLEWNHDDAKFILEGKLLYTQPTDNNWRKGRTIKLTPINALLVTNGKGYLSKMDLSQNQLYFSRYSAVREAAILLVRDKNGRYSLLRDPLYLDRCVIATDTNWKSYFEVQEILGKETYIFKAEDEVETKLWYQKLQYYAQGMGMWRKRRNALANIMISGMGLRS